MYNGLEMTNCRSFGLLLAALILLSGCRTGKVADRSASTDAGQYTATDPQSVVQGETIYTQHCAVCHGVSLEGEADWKLQNPDGSFRAPPHDAEGHTWHHDDAQLIEAIKRGGERLPPDIGGTSNMPAYEDVLSEDEITAVLDYIKSLWPEEIRTIQQQQTMNVQP